MNIWTRKSFELANQRDYLDQLFKVYPMANNLSRNLPDHVINELSTCFSNNDNEALINLLLRQKLFPVKDSYVAYLRKDKSAISRNPQTVNRLAGMIYDMGFDETINKMQSPKETNRQIGPLFKNWVNRKSLGVPVTNNPEEFINYPDNIAYSGSDFQMQDLAKNYLGYTHAKGLDFIAKFNDNYVIGEAKFLTDHGGHQNAQLNDAIATLRSQIKFTKYNVIKIAILDGVVYTPGRHAMRRQLENANDEEVVLSALLLRDFLYTI